MRCSLNSIAIVLICAAVFTSCSGPENVDWSGGDRAPDKLREVLWTESQVFLPFGSILVIESSKTLVFFQFKEYLPEKRGLTFEAVAVSRTGTQWSVARRVTGTIIWKPQFSLRGRKILIDQDVAFRTFGGSSVTLDGYKYGQVASVDTNDLKRTYEAIQWHERNGKAAPW